MENQFKGTKGEWTYRSQPIKQLGFYIETVNKSHKNTFIGEVGGGLQSYLETKANALLISKAPEMLELLDKLKDHFGLFPENRIAIKQLIKEATTL